MSWIYTRSLDEPDCRRIAEFGGKAAGLAKLAAAGLPVAPGFAVSASAFQEFLGTSGLSSRVSAAGPRNEEAHLAAAPVPAAIAAEIRRRYAALGAGDVDVAVRSSATGEDSETASFAGGFSTWLDVSGADDVIAHVRRCWAGLFTARAAAYSRASGADLGDMSMAVVVQRTVRADAAGVMFTVSPVTGDRSRIVIEAGWGLGLAVVGGEVTPDRWVVDKVSMRVVERVIADKHVEYRRGADAVAVPEDRRLRACLPDDTVIALARLGKRIEREDGRAQDIEFAVGADGPVLLQLRPETVWSRQVRVPRFTAGGDVTTWITGAVTAGGAVRSLAPTGHQHAEGE